MADDRLVELETKVAFQEDLVQTLNDVVVDLRSQVEALATTCEDLNRRIKDLASQLPSDFDPNEKPPHY